MRATFSRIPSEKIIAVVVAMVFLLPPVSSAAPTNSQIEAAKDSAAAARKRLDDLADDLEERTEEYLEIEAAVEATDQEIMRTERELELALTELAQTQGRLNTRVDNIYRNGGIDIVSVVVGVSDFQDLVSRLDLMRRIGRSDASLVAEVKAARERIATTKASLENRRTEQIALRAKAKAKREQVEAAVDEQERYLASIDAKLKSLIAEERARQERLAREAAARAAERAAAQAKSNSYAPGRTFDAAALGAPHPDVVAVARRFEGKTPYVWGGTTPSGFDCSGLTQYCYREIGVTIPRTSRTQFRVGAFIPPNRLDLLAPGDLVFFGRDGDPGRIHHVGIYVGGGDYIHAPQTGQRVSTSSLTGRIASRGDYVGATRP